MPNKYRKAIAAIAKQCCDRFGSYITSLCSRQRKYSHSIDASLNAAHALPRERIETVMTALLKAHSSHSTEQDCYNAAESLTMAVYPKYKFSEFGRICLEDKIFLSYYKQFMDAGNWHSFDRKYTLKELISVTTHLQGDVAECGTYKGASAYLMCEAHRRTGKTVHLFDSFEGLPSPGLEDGHYWTEGALFAGESFVRESLCGFKNYHVYKGWIPERFHEVAQRSFAFVHIDVDLYHPTLASLEFFYPKLVSGGIILMDDYGFKTCPGAKQAADEWFIDKPEKLVRLSTGQAFIIKQP